MKKLDALTSVNILKERVELWASKNAIDNYIFLESFNLPTKEQLKNRKIAFLFGDFIACFAYLNENKTQVEKVYVLCRKAKRMIDNCKEGKDIEVEVIDRYDLFKKAKIGNIFPNLMNDKVRLVYAGRITRSKNITIFLRLANQLQKVNPHISVQIFGEYDDFLNIDFNGKKMVYSYQTEVEKCINELEWSQPPSITHEISATQWPLLLEKQDLVVNLSTYWMDDFSVAIAQAQEIGIPILCTDIGGLSDVSANNVVKLPSFLLDSEFVNPSTEVDSIKAQNILEYIKVNKDLSPESMPHEALSYKLPEFKNLKLNQAFDFKNTVEGRAFFKKYFEVWNHTAHPSKKILFLVSGEQNHWLSLQTISEHIKHFWLAYQQNGYALEMVNVDEALDKKYVSRLKSYDLIVAPSLSLNTIKVMKLIRNTFGLKTPFVSYVHELPSTFFSALKLRGLTDIFTKDDIMVVQCESDLKLAKLSFENINVQMIPSCFSSDKGIQPEKYNIKNLFYIGRISEQKGLHFLFWSLSLIKQKLTQGNIKVNIYGVHDHLGMPNWGDGGGLYLDFLGDLIQELGLEELISFHGFSSKPNWGDYVKSKQGAGIFPSLHSDENFGVAPFDLLNEGIPVLLTKWGGYQDLANHYNPLVKNNNVYLSSKGPYIDPNEMAQNILNFVETDLSNIPSFKPKLDINEWVKSVSFKTNESNKPLIFSKISNELMGKIRFSSNISLKARGWALNGVMYSGPNDPNYLIACESYGAVKNSNLVEESYIMAPWVKNTEDGFDVSDPIKGRFTVKDLDSLFELGLAFKKLF